MTDDEISNDEINIFIMFSMLTAWMYRPDPWEWEVFDMWPQLPPGTQELFRRHYEKLDYDLHIFGPGLAIVYNPQRPSRWAIIKRILHECVRSKSS